MVGYIKYTQDKAQSAIKLYVTSNWITTEIT